MPIFGKASSSSLAAVRRGAAASGSSPGTSDLDPPRRASFSAALHAAAAATAGDEDLDAHADGAAIDGLPHDHDDHHDADHASETDPLLEATGADGIDLVKTVEKQSVWPILHYVRRLILNTIDTALSWDELTSIDLNFAIVRPLAHRLSKLKSIAVVYTLLLNKIQFGYEADQDLAYQQVNSTRAMLCELLAIKMLRTFSRDGIELVTALTAPFSPFAGADEGAITDFFLSRSASKHARFSSSAAVSSLHPDRKHSRALGSGGSSLSALYANTKSSALELAIQGRATKFLNSPLARRCVDGIWTGRVVISSHASHAIIEDSYKTRPLSIYDPNKAPVLDHYRLRVPLIRSRLEFLNFLVLLILFLIALGQRGTLRWTIPETIFSIWLAGFALDEFAQMQEHGLGIYFGSLDNGLDALLIIICSFFLGFRISGLVHADVATQELAFDCLALGAIVLCPRVASIFVADSVVLLSLKAMLADFLFFMSLAMVCFSGFWLTFWSLVEDRETWTPGAILWTMLRICFFAGYVDLSVATKFSPIFGPPLFVFFAVVSNVMLLTILISSLSNTFTVVAMRADEEAAYQHACRSMAGISSDALFSYIPPLNLIGFAIILPCKFILTERYLHKVHVFLVRSLSFPILLTIRLVERQSFKHGLELTAERGRRAFSFIPLIGSSRSREEREVLDMVFSHEPSALTADPDAYARLASGATGVGHSAIYSPGESAVESARISLHHGDDDDDDADGDGNTKTGTRKDTGSGYLDQMVGKLIEEGEAREALMSTLKEQAKGEFVAAQALEEESPRQAPAAGSASEGRQSMYGQHLAPEGLPVPPPARAESSQANATSTAVDSDIRRAPNLPRTRTRTTTMSSRRSAAAALTIPPAPSELSLPSPPPPRGLGSLSNPLARFFGGNGAHLPPSGRRAQRKSSQPPFAEQVLHESPSTPRAAAASSSGALPLPALPPAVGPAHGDANAAYAINTFGSQPASPAAAESPVTSVQQATGPSGGDGKGPGAKDGTGNPAGRGPQPNKHGLEDSPAARALLKRMDRLEKSNEAMLELLRSLVAASATKD